MIIVGTSGWSYDDWVGEFYPPGMGKDKWLEFYARYFHTTEINSTYYSFPVWAMVRAYFNNHPRANAVRNAKLFESLMGQPGEPLNIKKQADLSSFF